MQLYLVYFESANYAGYGEHCVVQADSAEIAEDIAIPYAENYYCDEEGDQWYEENDDEPPSWWANIKKIELFTPEHDSWKHFLDPIQRNHYMVPINFKFEEVVND